jgi:hypothetical protein
MDQIRIALGWLKRNHFWVLCGLVALIAFGCWWSASQKASAAYDTGQKTIAAGFSEVQSVRSAAFHANQAIIDRQTAENQKQLESVAKLWQQLYDKQREQVLKWPTALSKEFRDAVEKLQFNADIPYDLRNNYQNYIERHFPELPKQIGARPLDINAPAGIGGAEYTRGPSYGVGLEGGIPGMTPGMVPEDDYICEWLDQAVIRDELNFPQRPSALRIWVTQEDLWVYHTLLDVIARTNQAAGATRMSNAAVKVVYSLEVGQRAAPYSRQPGRILVRPAIAAAAPGEGPMGPEGPGGPPGAMRGGPGAGMMERGMGRGEGRFGSMGPGGGNTALSPAQEQGALLSFRYLDDKGQPIPIGGAGVGEAGAAPEPVPADPAAANATAPTLDLNQFGTGYKRLPIRMVLQMDARWLQQLIAICGSEPLRVEVQEVCIDPSDASGLESGVGGGGRFGGYGERGPGGAGGAAGASYFPDRTGIQNFPSQPHVKNVIIQGTIYIFNKPDLSNLQQPAAQSTAGL